MSLYLRTLPSLYDLVDEHEQYEYCSNYSCTKCYGINNRGWTEKDEEEAYKIEKWLNDKYAYMDPSPDPLEWNLDEVYQFCDRRTKRVRAMVWERRFYGGKLRSNKNGYCRKENGRDRTLIIGRARSDSEWCRNYLY